MGIRLIKISVLYFVIGVSIGLYMSIAHSYTLTPVHVHINLLGWTALTLAGIIYYLFPHLASNKLAIIHFWLHNISLPIMMLGLAFVVYGYDSLVPFVAAGGTVLVFSIFVFAINIVLNINESK